MFQVFIIRPRHDNRDAIVGSYAVAHPYNFVTEAGAFGVCCLLQGRSDECGGDDVHVVVAHGASPFDRRAVLTPAHRPDRDQDIPF